MARQGRCSFILPITDPYVVHHGALGSFATAYMPQGADREAIMKRLRAINGIYLVVGREEGRRSFELPEDRLGDIIMLSSENKTIGTSEHRHNLAALNEPREASQSRLFPSSPTRSCPINHCTGVAQFRCLLLRDHRGSQRTLMEFSGRVTVCSCSREGWTSLRSRCASPASMLTPTVSSRCITPLYRYRNRYRTGGHGGTCARGFRPQAIAQS